jgi:PAS domain S-box-containing protein
VNQAQHFIQAGLLGEALEHGPVAVFVADEHMRYIAVNVYACELLGYTRDELLQLRVTDVSGSGAEQEFATFLTEGHRTGTIELRRKDGSTFDFKYVASETTIAGMSLFVSVGCPTP